jgi:hypothetical protein
VKYDSSSLVLLFDLSSTLSVENMEFHWCTMWNVLIKCKQNVTPKWSIAWNSQRPGFTPGLWDSPSPHTGERRRGAVSKSHSKVKEYPTVKWGMSSAHQHPHTPCTWTTCSQNTIPNFCNRFFFPNLLAMSIMLRGALFFLLFIPGLHVVSFSDCAEPQIADSQRTRGPGQPHPCGWDSPLCSPGAVKLGIVDQMSQRSGKSKSPQDTCITTQHTCLS